MIHIYDNMLNGNGHKNSQRGMPHSKRSAAIQPEEEEEEEEEAVAPIEDGKREQLQRRQTNETKRNEKTLNVERFRWCCPWSCPCPCPWPMSLPLPMAGLLVNVTARPGSDWSSHCYRTISKWSATLATFAYPTRSWCCCRFFCWYFCCCDCAERRCNKTTKKQKSYKQSPPTI